MEKESLKVEKVYSNGGVLYSYRNLDRKKSDYNAVRKIGREFAKEGHIVVITPRLHQSSPEYKAIYGSLIGTRYYPKCPDLTVDGRFYEYEGYEKPWNKHKVGRMLSHGFKQSPNVIINNTKGCSDRYIRKLVIDRQHDTYAPRMDEIWLYEKGNVRLFYKNGVFYKNNGGNCIPPRGDVP